MCCSSITTGMRNISGSVLFREGFLLLPVQPFLDYYFGVFGAVRHADQRRHVEIVLHFVLTCGSGTYFVHNFRVLLMVDPKLVTVGSYLNCCTVSIG